MVAGGSEGMDAIVGGWPQLLEVLTGTAGVRVRALLRDASPVDLTDDLLTIGFRYAIFSEKAQEPLNRQELEKALNQVYGRAFRLSFRTVSPDQLRPVAAPAVQASAVPTGDPAPAAGGEGVVKAAVEILGARITNVTPRRRGETES